MAILFDVFAKAGEYKNSKGEDKVRWHKCGVAIEARTDSGMALNIESLPTNFDGWLQLYKPREKDQPQGQATKSYTASTPDIGPEDIPF